MFDPNEFRDLSRTVMQVEYLLLCMVLLYVVIPGTLINDKQLVIMGGVVYAAFLLLYQYVFTKKITALRLSIKAIITTLFITYVVWFTGQAESPLSSLYVISVISSAMVIGRSTTLLLVGLIAACGLLFEFHNYNVTLFTVEHMGKLIELVINVFGLLLVAYLTFMLASHMQHAKDIVRASSELDELTGLLNRRTFTNILERDYRRFSQYSNQFSILVIDIDNIKTINDQHGFVSGNRLIVLVANTIKRAINQNDMIARFGGDEFIVLLAELGRDSAKKMAEKIRTHVDTTPLILEGGKEIFTSVSIGVACYPGDSTDLSELVKRADLAMYESKEHGKNQTTLYATLFQEGAQTFESSNN